MNGKLYIFVLLTVLVVLELHFIDGARGGSRGGYRSSSSSRSRTRSSTSRSSSSSRIRLYSGPKYRMGSWKTAAAIGTLYGVMSYKRRQMYLSYPNREPRVCYNEKNLRGGTYGYFICPEEFQKDDFAYCCGSDDEQRCCTYTDKSAEGRIAGIVIGVVVGCIIIGVVVYCCIVRRRRQKQQAKGGVILKDATKSTDGGGSYIPEQQPLKSHDFQGGGGQQYPMQTYNTQPGFGAPQAYDPNAQGLPYSTNPGVPGTAKFPPSEGPEVYPQGPNPYPPPPPPEPYPPQGAPNPSGAPASIGFAESEPYPQAPPGFYPGGYPPPTGAEAYQQQPPGPYPGGYPPLAGQTPSAPPPSYEATQ